MSLQNKIIWSTYKLYCHNRGLCEGRLETLEAFMEYRNEFYKEEK